MIRTRLATLLATAAFAVAVIAASPLLAEAPGPSSPPTAPKSGGTAKPTKEKSAKPGNKKKSEIDAPKSGQSWLDGFWAAHALIQNGQYEAGIAALHALGTDYHADVANYLGYASRKLGHYDEAKHWYEAALEADPNHTRTWQYFGMWHLEQGNRLKAEDHLAKIKSLCGTECHDYVALREALDGRMVY